jgi:tetratricopeptide (TPR) repeat protein
VSRRPALTGLLATAALTLSALANAQLSPAAAEALFREGREAMKQGNLAVACPKLAESQRLDPSHGTLLNLAMCEEASGKLALAWAHFRELVDTLPPADDRVAVARARAQQVGARLLRLTLEFAAPPPPGTQVALDGQPLGSAVLGSAVPLDPGLHRVLVSAPGRMAAPYVVSGTEGAKLTLRIEPGPPPPPPAPRPTEPAPAPGPLASEPSHGLAHALLGAGVAGLSSSLAAGAFALSRKSVVEDHCPGKHCDDEGSRAAASGKVMATASTALALFSAGSLALGVYLRLRAPSTPGLAVALGVHPTSGGGLVGVHGGF